MEINRERHVKEEELLEVAVKGCEAMKELRQITEELLAEEGTRLVELGDQIGESGKYMWEELQERLKEEEK